jgi:hypothetical protein
MMPDLAKEPARNSALSITDTLVRVMEDAGDKDYTRCVVIAMNDDGTRRYLYSNARSEPEMFGMIEMSREGFTNDVSEEDDQ